MRDVEGRKEAFKDVVRQAKAGAGADDLKKKLKDALGDVDAAGIARLEEELVKDGTPVEDIHKLCDAHIALLKEMGGAGEDIAPQGHPIWTLLEEHKLMLAYAGQLRELAGEMKSLQALNVIRSKLGELGHLADHFKDAEKHYLREENVLFPYLEKHGVTQPPAVMWTEHDKIREIKKNLYRIVDGQQRMAYPDFTRQLEAVGKSLAEMLGNHFYKEGNILFPTALEVIPEREWAEIKKQCDDIGYTCFTPGAPAPEAVAEGVAEVAPEGAIAFESGQFSRDELETLLNTLPVDITFVDKDDTVRYFSQSKDRIFVRTKAVIGRKVQQCHPQKSVHVVEKILDDFRTGRRDMADFWLNVKGRLVYIRYLALRDGAGAYLGCLEVSEDVSGIKKLEGEKRLL